MIEDDIGEEMARRSHDRHGNAPLTRGPDPDRVARHLATGEGDETLIAKKRVDGFRSESPIRAFTDFQVSGTVAIGKGFRPAMAHLSRYLDAMLAKEGWEFVQVLLPDNDAGDPTILFKRVAHTIFVPPGAEKGHPFADPYVDAAKMIRVDGELIETEPRTIGKVPELAAPYGRTEFARYTDQPGFDPINPTYYGGTACAEIIEYMPTNVGLAGKYCWRLGEKDSEEQEAGKAIWYLKREMILHTQEVAPRPVFGIPQSPAIVGLHSGTVEWYKHMAKERITARKLPEWRRRIMVDLVLYTVTGQIAYLTTAIDEFERRGGETGTGLAV